MGSAPRHSAVILTPTQLENEWVLSLTSNCPHSRPWPWSIIGTHSVTPVVKKRLSGCELGTWNLGLGLVCIGLVRPPVQRWVRRTWNQRSTPTGDVNTESVRSSNKSKNDSLNFPATEEGFVSRRCIHPRRIFTQLSHFRCTTVAFNTRSRHSQ